MPQQSFADESLDDLKFQKSMNARAKRRWSQRQLVKNVFKQIFVKNVFKHFLATATDARAPDQKNGPGPSRPAEMMKRHDWQTDV